jgi:outer membrane autotransporter protein
VERLLGQAGQNHAPTGGVMALAAGSAAARVALAGPAGTSDAAEGPLGEAVAAASEGVAAPWSAWASGFGATGSVDGDGNSHRLDETIAGGAVGLDGRVAPGLLVGVGLGYASTALGVNDGGGQGDVDAVQAGLYASWAGGDGFYADGVLGYAHGSNSLSRNCQPAGAAGDGQGFGRGQPVPGRGGGGGRAGGGGGDGGDAVPAA